MASVLYYWCVINIKSFLGYFTIATLYWTAKLNILIQVLVFTCSELDATTQPNNL